MTDEDSRMRDFMLTFRKMLFFLPIFLGLSRVLSVSSHFSCLFDFLNLLKLRTLFISSKSEREREIDKKKNICFLIWGLWRIFNQAFRHYYFYALKKRKKSFSIFSFLFICWREQKVTQICQRVKVSVTNMLH